MNEQEQVIDLILGSMVDATFITTDMSQIALMLSLIASRMPMGHNWMEVRIRELPLNDPRLIGLTETQDITP